MQKIILGCIVFLSVLLLAQPTLAAPAPETLDEVAVQRVGQNCRQAQVQLKTLQKRDTVLRINRGRLYDMTLRQTGAFVARLDVNKIDAPVIKQADGTIRAELQHFKEDYDRYADSLGLAIAIDCAAKPREFYTLLGQTAQARLAVGADVAKIKQGLAEYSGALVQLRDKMTAPAGVQP